MQHCYECHSAGAKKIQGGLTLDTREGLLRGGESGPAVVPGKPGQSLLIQAFGRTSLLPKDNGSNHNSSGFTFWLAGGGVKGGLAYGKTNETGRVAVENKVGFHDLHSTILHQLGLDYEQLTYRFAGRDFRINGTEPTRVVKEILA